MPLRQLQIVIPSGRNAVFESVAEDLDLRVLWLANDRSGERSLAVVAADAYATDAILEKLLETFDGFEDFSVTVTEVGAVYPRPPEKKEQEEEDEAEDVSSSADDEGEPEEKDRKLRRVTIEELEEQIRGDSSFDRNFLITVMLSTVVAAAGLMRDNTAVVIGAMVIAPLLGPNMALALGSALGSTEILWRALKTNAAGMTVAFVLALGMGFVLPVDPAVPEIASRTTVSIADLALALAAGAAGALAFTTGAPAALVGVMVAVALVPPLVSGGLLLGSAFVDEGLRALLLTVANVIAINLAAVGTFAFQSVTPRDYYEAGKAKRMMWRALAIWLVSLGALAAIVLWLPAG